ncbi:MAG TPA: hypothetical protein VF218_07630 [Acidothermaceae bacterium]
MIDFDKYTLGELAKIEELTGLSIPDLMRPGAPQMKKTAAVCFVEAKRQGLNHTWASILNWSPTQVNEFLREAKADDGDEPAEDEPDPKASSAKSKRKTSRSSSSRSGSNPRSTGG